MQNDVLLEKKPDSATAQFDEEEKEETDEMVHHEEVA